LVAADVRRLLIPAQEVRADLRRLLRGYLLKRGRDRRKDQSYFLFSLRQDQLARAMFPLGEKTKSDTREVARHCQLKTADKEESMEICFVPDKDYGGFLHAGKPRARNIAARSWTCTGACSAITTASNFTPSASARDWASQPPKPVYVIELDAANNRVIVGDDSALDRDEFTVHGNCNWHSVRQIDGANRSHGRRFVTTIPARLRP
jgi:tRNA-specific 2-thiouridylase